MRRALAFLTPIGGAAPPSSSAVSWFPLAGALIGGVVGAMWWLAGEVWPALLAATLAVAADLLLTGALHIDGLGDTADGLLPHLSPARRLEVMADPHLGAFGVSAIVMVIALRIAALAAIEPNALVVAALWCASRTLMAVATRTLAYARPGGLATAFLGGSPFVVGGYGLALAFGLALFGARGQGAAAVVAVVVVGAAVLALAQKQIGGFTGDVLGACGVLGETAGLLVLAASW